MYNIYVVSPGDTIESIAARYNTTPKELYEINSFLSQNEPLSIGQRIIIPVPKTDTFEYYTIKKGDTIYNISRKYDLRVRDLMRANPFVNVYNLQVGEELCIPVTMEMPGNGLRPYVVKRDDTLLSILRENNITFEELARLNRSAAVLKLPAGTVLLLPQA